MKTKFVHPPRVLGNVERLQVELLVRQMPIEARTSNKSDRRVLDPTPVVEVCFYDPESQARVRVPIYQLNGYTLFAALVAADTGKHIAFLSDGITSALSGPANSAPTPAPDPDTDPALPATFFAFPDIGVRLTGTYRLRFTLSLCGDTEHTKRMVMFSAPFRVVSGAHYRGVKLSTPLTCTLAKNGVRARVRKNIWGTMAGARMDGMPAGKSKRRRGPDRIQAPRPCYPSHTLALLAPSPPPPCADSFLDLIFAAAAGNEDYTPTEEDSFLADWYSSDFMY